MSENKSLTKEQLLTIRNEIIKQIKDKYPKVKIANEEIEEKIATLRVFVDVFTAGNRALRFWVGFGYFFYLGLSLLCPLFSPF